MGKKFGAPDLELAEGVTPICSDFLRFLPICSDLCSLFLGIPRFVPICSDLLSEQIRTNQGSPFLLTPFANPRKVPRKILQENPRQNPPTFAQNSPTHFCRGARPRTFSSGSRGDKRAPFERALCSSSHLCIA